MTKRRERKPKLRHRILAAWVKAMRDSDIDDVILVWTEGKRP
jgi:hypothetical protein